ncbi:MAG: MFS transporter [Actinomycetes bacterium]
MALPDSRRSWGLVAVAFAVMLVVVGTGYSYGAVLPRLVDDLGIGAGTASAVFAATVFVFFVAGAPAGVLADRFGARRLLLGGAAAAAVGLAVTSRANGPWALVLGHGVLLGAAMATTFVPMLAVVASAFERHRTAALGVAVSGIGVGTLTMAPLLAALAEWVGWRDAYQVIAGVVLVVLLAGAAVLPGRTSRPRQREQRGGPLREVMGSGDYRRLYLAQMLLAVALFVPFALLPAFAQSLGVMAVPAAGLVGVLGLASVVGRLALSALAERVGVVATYRACYLLVASGFVLWLLPAAGHLELLLFAVVFGLGYGGFVALLPAVVTHLFGLARFGAMVGVLYTANAAGAAVGPWAAGAMVDRFGYTPAAVMGCAFGAAAFGVLRGVGRRPLP